MLLYYNKYMSDNLKKQINIFLEYIEIERGRSQNTVKNYCFYLYRFAKWCETKDVSAVSDVSQDLVRNYRLWLNRIVDTNGNPLKKNTQNYHLIAVRAFLKFLSKNDIEALAPEKIELAKMPQREVDFLEGSDLERLLNAPLGDNHPNDDIKSKIVLRDKALLELLFCTGLRVSELASLKKDNINLDRDEFSIRGKGSKLRVVFLSEQSKYWLKKYLKARRDMNPYLFVSHDRAASGRNEKSDKIKGLTARSVQRIVEKYTKIAGIPKNVTPHTLRHSYATDLLMNGADIRSVQAMLGHASITTTQVYTHITNKQLREIHKKFHNRGK